MTARPTLHVTPPDALIDVPRSIIATHFPAHAIVTIAATSAHADGTVWRSSARYRANDDGTLDLSKSAPLEGDYSGVDASGLLWSLALQQGKEGLRAEETIDNRTITLTASANEDSTPLHASPVTLTQRLVAEGVSRQAIAIDGLVGTLFKPAGTGPHPVVIVLNGSGGGINEARAALYAAHGYTALALGYFGAPGLKAHISGTPLEYFSRALDWVHDTLTPLHGFVAVAGQSRGAELALLLGSRFPAQVNAVLAYVPSHVVHGTLRAGAPGEAPTTPAWLWQGVPLATVWENNRRADWAAFESTASPVRQAPSFSSALLDADAVARARIDVTKIAGPVLLLSGTDDGFWPSSAMADSIRNQLLAAAHPYPVVHLCYDGAGHAIQFPFVPTTRIVKAHAVAKVDLTGGGTPAANAHANADSWPGVLTFLAEAVKAHAAQAR